MLFAFNVDNLGPLETVETSVLLEKIGFNSIWLADHLVDIGGAGFIDPWTVGGAIATCTKKINIFSAVTDTQRCHPAKTAHMIANLDVLSRGRAILGIGAGEAMNTTPFGIKWEKPSDRIARLREAIEIIKLLWTSSSEKRSNYSGRFYDLANAYLDQLPFSKPHPPIFIGAMYSKRMLSLIGEIGNGWIGWINTPETFKTKVQIIRISARNAGRENENIQTATMLPVVFPRDNEPLEEFVLNAKAYLFSERRTIESLGYEPPVFPDYQNFLPLREKYEELLELAESVPEEYVYRCVAFGEEQCIRMIEDLAEVGANQLAIININEPNRSKEIIERFGKIIRYFESQ